MLVQGEGKILCTEKTPEIILTPEGVVRIKGRWMMGHNASFSKALSDWYDAYIFDLHEITAIDIYLEYFSGFNLGILISLLRKLSCIKLVHREQPINWYYEEGDEDIHDLGEYISSVLGTKVNLIMICDKKSEVDIATMQQ